MLEVGSSLAHPEKGAPEPWGGRRRERDIWRRLVTSGAPAGTSGARRRALIAAYLGIAAVMLAVAGVNVLTEVDDARRLGHVYSVLEVGVWELSSVVAGLAAAAVAYWALAIAPIDRRRPMRTIATHALASLVFSAVHIGGMVALRVAVYAAAGSAYRFGISEIPYEYRKDVLSYAGLVAAFWAAQRWLGDGGGAAAARAAVEVVTFDIEDGGSLIRAPVREILAARAAGNYVEFVLADGRRPLMRAALGKIEASLAPYGFVRTHRSWIVNGERVRVIEAAGSGDFRVEIDGGVSAPVSRRFPEALKQLRDGGSSG
jgi:DNA-binding LytR/AlgR family response regulator